ncbi:MAG: hypothetical protein CBB93_006215 [Oceanospirillales bacterium TMED33]|nr:MAG: hypothetical protein CBB93_006215 [Oceanospirillales bacterium TMED33]|tara:strand:- start:80 stop:598 length:519 start_codon:yes stop_codon:yes gene_type:complete
MSNGASQAIVTSGFCAERHSAQATRFRIQKPNSSERSFAFVVHPKVMGIFTDCIGSDYSGPPSQAVLYTSDEGFGDVDLLFTITPPDFLTFVCPDAGCDEKHLDSVIARIDRWMQHRFITTIMVDLDRSKTGSFTSDQLTGELRRISSQLVWVTDGQDLKEVLTALRFFSES